MHYMPEWGSNETGKDIQRRLSQAIVSEELLMETEVDIGSHCVVIQHFLTG